MSFAKYYQSHIDSMINSLKKIDLSKTELLINSIEKCHGNIFFTGIGKNGHVASKACSTFCSIGLKAFFLDPIDSLHGDMGAINDNDLVITISKSGNTDELITFLKYLNRKNCFIISIHSNEFNETLKYSHFDINLNIDREADNLNLIPTTSIAIFTVFLQSIACEIAKRKELTKQDFIFNHPGGSIGKLK